MNYGRVNNVVCYSELISLEAKGLYAIICSLCGNKDYCFPAVSTLSKMSGKSRATVHRLLKELSDKGVIQRLYNPTQRKTITYNLMDKSKISKNQNNE
jgi:DNA-binding MarR family transcriptional regulator